MTTTMEPTVHRTRRRGTSAARQNGVWQQAPEVATVTVNGYGAGWYITAVNQGAGQVQVYRDGSEMTIDRSQVQ
jgi:hypothetical protein